MSLDVAHEPAVQTQRGYHFQTSAFLFYVLMRWREFPDLEAVIEPSEGEDAKIVYTCRENGKTRQVVELIQYKKRESTQQDPGQPQLTIGDDWQEAKIQPSLLKKWIKTKRAGKSTLEVLQANTDCYYTAIVFGELSPSVAKFAVRELPTLYTYREYPLKFSKAFPVTYTHQNDPLPSPKNLTFGTKEIRQRVRILRFGSPYLLEAQCRLLLEIYFENKKSFSANTYEQLYLEIRRRELATGEQNRRLDLGVLTTIIEAGRISKAQWQDVKTLLEPAEVDTEKDALHSTDFEKGSYVHQDSFDDAWKALYESGFVVICGGAGIGKTTLARYLAHQFLKHFPSGRAFYLHLVPGERLIDEKEFLIDQIGNDTLFIVDDQHLSVDYVEPLIEAYSDYYRANIAKAKLIVTSSITYGRAGRGAFGIKPSELRRGTLIHLQRASPRAMSEIVQALKTRTSLQTELSNEELAELSQGNIGLAIVIARCAQRYGDRLSYQEMAESETLQRMLMEWIFEKLGTVSDRDYYLAQIVPLFVIGAREVPIPEDYRDSIDSMYRAGFLRAEYVDDELVYFPANHALSILISLQNHAAAFSIWNDYFHKYRKRLPIICERLAANDFGRSLLEKLCQGNFDTFVEELADNQHPLDLDGVGKVLNSVDLASRRRESTRLLSGLVTPYGQFRNNFFLHYVRIDRIQDADVSSLTNFFNALHNIDRVLIGQVARAQLVKQHEDETVVFTEAGEALANMILTFVSSPESRLDEVGACLQAAYKCSDDFGRLLYKRWTESAAFAEKITKTQADERSVFIGLRYCENIRFLNRHDCLEYMKHYAKDTDIAEITNNSTEFSRVSALLTSLRRLNSQKASDIIIRMYEEHLPRLTELLRNDKSIVVLTYDIYTISLLNKRIGVKLALRLKSYLFPRINEIEQFTDLGSVVRNLRRAKDVHFLGEAEPFVNREVILDSFRKEVRSFDLVGITLSAVAECWPDLAIYLGEHLNYETFINRIRRHFVMQYVHIIRGFFSIADLQTGGFDHFFNEILSNRSLVRKFNKVWMEADNVTENSFCLSQLLDIADDKSKVIELLGFANAASFETDIIKRFSFANAAIHIANGLFAVAKYDLYVAYQVLEHYISRFISDTKSEEGLETTRPRRLPPRTNRPRLPQGYRVNDFVDIGCLFRAAASVDASLARKLVEHVDFEKFASNVTGETNLGRLTVFIVGLQEVSRKHVREFVARISTPKIWREQFETNEKLENSIHFARAVGHVSRLCGGKYVRFLIDEYADLIKDHLSIEANVMLIGNWLRVLPSAGTEAVQKHAKDIEPFLLSTTYYDTRVRPLLEATQALIECQQLDSAKQFAKRTLKEAKQIVSVRKLADWIVLFQKSLGIARSLELPDFPSNLFSKVPAWSFFPRMFASSQPILRAYVYHLLTTIDVVGFEDIQKGLHDRQELILEDARQERRVINKILSLILAGAPVEEIRKLAHHAESLEFWEIGLLALVFSSVFPEEKNPFTDSEKTQLTDWRNTLQTHLSDHSHNIEFGLTVRLALIASKDNTLIDTYGVALKERADDEIVRPISWLLRPNEGIPDSTVGLYYLWSLLKRTVMRSSYIAWDGEITNRVSSETMKQQHLHDYESLVL